MEDIEEYVNEETLIKDEGFDSLPEELIICPICLGLMIVPVLCINCLNHYCKKCIEEWKKKEGTCPNKCPNPMFKDEIEKNRLINKLKFKCKKGCGEILLFKDIKSHYSSNCLENKSKMRILPKNQVNQYRKNNKNIDYLTSK